MSAPSSTEAFTPINGAAAEQAAAWYLAAGETSFALFAMQCSRSLKDLELRVGKAQHATGRANMLSQDERIALERIAEFAKDSLAARDKLPLDLFVAALHTEDLAASAHADEKLEHELGELGRARGRCSHDSGAATNGCPL